MAKSSFREITFTNGSEEIMLHIAVDNPDKVLCAYCYAEDAGLMLIDGRDKEITLRTVAMKNPLFAKITFPALKRIRAILEANEFFSELDNE